MHTDKYGRTWRFKPNHDADCMVQVPWDVMLIFMIADRMLTHANASETDWLRREFEHTKPDCYVLKLGDYLYTGARMSDDPPDYRSSCIHNKGSLDAMLWYVWLNTSLANLQAMTDLLGRVERPAQCW
ncbi:hypothetical protein [Cupriavidus basilensis]|uniref:hypothetical protein n=1 Tax=Cupriavidus basilensis TaxID=68895 RepID=UPI0020A6D5F8|nr:hypothetical protein [Cupriavidus basilensis]MCP3017419.1 hypothetical protein [Cupriavidus basilensis]